MVRVIKAPKESLKPSKVIIESDRVVGGGRLIEGDVYRAQQRAREILKEGEQERKRRLAKGKQEVALAREEAMAKGAVEAFETVAREALIIFKEKAGRYADVEKDVRLLAEEVAKKILGSPLSLSSDVLDKMTKAGIHKLKMRRQLKIQFAKGRLKELNEEAPVLVKQVQSEPDFEMGESSDVKRGFVRVLTEVGSALMEESLAMETLNSIFSEQNRS